MTLHSTIGPATAEINNMNKQWKASRYRYPDARPRNEDRYEIFMWENEKWVNVVGAIRKWGGKTIAFLCMPATQRGIRAPRDAERKTDGLLAQVGTGGQNCKTGILVCDLKHSVDCRRRQWNIRLGEPLVLPPLVIESQLHRPLTKEVP